MTRVAYLALVLGFGVSGGALASVVGAPANIEEQTPGPAAAAGDQAISTAGATDADVAETEALTVTARRRPQIANLVAATDSLIMDPQSAATCLDLIKREFNQVTMIDNAYVMRRGTDKIRVLKFGDSLENSREWNCNGHEVQDGLRLELIKNTGGEPGHLSFSCSTEPLNGLFGNAPACSATSASGAPRTRQVATPASSNSSVSCAERYTPLSEAPANMQGRFNKVAHGTGRMASGIRDRVTGLYDTNAVGRFILEALDRMEDAADQCETQICARNQSAYINELRATCQFGGRHSNFGKKITALEAEVDRRFHVGRFAIPKNDNEDRGGSDESKENPGGDGLAEPRQPAKL